MFKNYTLEEHENSMTIFYYLRTGQIFSWATGIQDFNSFGEHAEDFEQILGCLVLPKDLFILENMKMFKVDVESQALVYNEELIQKYSSYRG